MIIPRITESDLHAHLKARMEQRGVTLEELRFALDEGWKAMDVRGIILLTVKARYGSGFPKGERHAS